MVKKLQYLRSAEVFELYAMNENYDNFNLENLHEISNILNIQITKKDKKDICASNPYMMGFPLVAVDKFIQILLNNDYTVVIIEQVTEPPEPERKVTNIYSPGTNIDYCNNNDSSNLVSIYIFSFKDLKNYKEKYCVGLSNIDLTTGKSIIYECFSEVNDEKNIR